MSKQSHDKHAHRGGTGSRPLPFNEAAALFRALYAFWHQDAASEAVDRLAAELAARVAAASAPLCLGLLRSEAVPSYYGLVYLLDGYGLLLRKRYHADGRSVFVMLERKGDAPVENADAVVRVRGEQVPGEPHAETRRLAEAA